MCDFSHAEMLLADVVEACSRNMKFPADIQALKKLELFSALDCCEWLFQVHFIEDPWPLSVYQRH